jgi:hypothetical protein
MADRFPTTEFRDWSQATVVEGVPTVVASHADDVVRFCNEAAARNAQGMKVRALGHSHNWSPLILPTNSAANPNVLLVDTRNLTGQPTATVVGNQVHATFGAGTTLEEATAFLESLDNAGASQAPGYGFLNMPAPGGLSLGGILAVGGHGTSVPGEGATEPDLMGCLSNLIVSFKAVTTDPTDPASHYSVREFDRAHPDAPAFLTHLGRAFITEVTLAAVPNYFLKLTNKFPTMKELMASPGTPSPNSLSSLLDSYGRVEAIWFPYADEVWVQCMERERRKPSNPVSGPYNYGWMNGISLEWSNAVKDTLIESPSQIKSLSEIEEVWTRTNESGVSLTGTARDLEIYLTSDTLRMGIFGYALQLPRSEIQRVANEFYDAFSSLLQTYNRKDQWPVNGAVEIRCTTLDKPGELGIAGARPPALSVTHAVDAAASDVDTVLWLDVLAFPATPNSSRFFTDLEHWMIATWHPRYSNRLRPEWSKGWAYTESGGPWTDTELISKWVPSLYDAATDGLTFAWARQTLAKYDGANIFSNDWLTTLFG